MIRTRLSTAALCAALFVFAACGPKDAPGEAPPVESAPAVAELPEVRYYQISDS